MNRNDETTPSKENVMVNETMLKSALRIGIDVGSTTVKLAILDEANDVKFSVYRRHHATCGLRSSRF